MKINDKYCIYCGLEHAGKEKYCKNCGKKLSTKHADFEAFVRKTSKEKIKDEAVGKAYDLVKNWLISRLYGIIVTITAVFTATSVVAGVSAMARQEENVPVFEFPEVSKYKLIEFGMYPQTELVLAGSGVEAAITEIAGERHLTYESVNQEAYSILENADYDANDDATVTINGETIRVRRLCRNTAEWHTYTPTSYPYEVDYREIWHYFKYEPIKWRVLSEDKKEYLLMCDFIIDNYTSEFTDNTYDWAHSTIRQRLNSEFINTAFTSDEAAKILVTNLENKDVVDGVMIGKGCENTQDKVFLPSIYDIFEIGYDDVNEDRNELIDIQMHYSTYAHANGVFGGDHDYDATRGGPAYGNWWTRSMFPNLDWIDANNLMCIKHNAKAGSGILDTGIVPFMRVGK